MDVKHIGLKLGDLVATAIAMLQFIGLVLLAPIAALVSWLPLTFFGAFFQIFTNIQGSLVFFEFGAPTLLIVVPILFGGSMLYMALMLWSKKGKWSVIDYIALIIGCVYTLLWMIVSAGMFSTVLLSIPAMFVFAVTVIPNIWIIWRFGENKKQ